jgi:hypothetical protein
MHQPLLKAVLQWQNPVHLRLKQSISLFSVLLLTRKIIVNKILYQHCQYLLALNRGFVIICADYSHSQC